MSKPDLILLDLMLPGISGEELLMGISGIPVIVVSARAGVDDKVGMLMNGACDYVTKPFEIEELLARICLRLREAKDAGGPQILAAGDIRIDLDRHQVTVQGQEVHLTRTEYAVLKCLVEHPKQVMAKSVLLDSLCMETPDCTENSLKTHVSNLRGKLRGISGEDYIEAVWGIGFCLKEV